MLFIAGGLGFKTYIFFVVDDDRARARLLHRLLLHRLLLHTPSYPLVLVLVHARVFVITAIALALARSLSVKVFIAPQLPAALVKPWLVVTIRYRGCPSSGSALCGLMARRRWRISGDCRTPHATPRPGSAGYQGRFRKVCSPAGAPVLRTI